MALAFHSIHRARCKEEITMKLNADIIFDGLAKSFQVTMTGAPEKALTLGRPTMYMEGSTEFLADTLYIASADHLPVRPVIHKSTVMICVGDSLNVRPFLKRCTVITVSGNVHFFDVYLALQGLFDRFDAWNDELFALFKETPAVESIVALSENIFGEPLLAIDSEFHFMAASPGAIERLREKWQDETEHLNQYSMNRFLSENSMMTDEHAPIIVKTETSEALAVNLFDRWERYIGCLVVFSANAPLTAGTEALADYLARIMEKAIEKNPSVLTGDRNVRKDALRDLVDGTPLSINRRMLLRETPGGNYLCTILQPTEAERELPAGFICSSFEIAFPHGYAFTSDYGIVGIVDLAGIGCTDGPYREAVLSRMTPLLESLRMTAGVSNDFSDLTECPLYVTQANAAIENGASADPGTLCHFFLDHALTEMTINALAGAPVESYLPAELRKLIEHDKTSGVSLMETLEVYLRENMNMSQSAKLLYVHRSTLIDRIARIENDYGVDIRTHEGRLYVELLLHAIHVRDRILHAAE